MTAHDLDTLVVCLALLSYAIYGLASPLPQHSLPEHYNANGHTTKGATILEQEFVHNIGNYNFAYKTSDGASREERAQLKNVGKEQKEALVVEGSYSYVGTDGNTYTVNYIADENGFRPTGLHIPGIESA